MKTNLHKLFKPSRVFIAMAAMALPMAAAANQSLNYAGYASTTGGVVNEGSLHSSSFNPAGNNLLLKQNERLRFGYLSNLGGYIEIGDVNDLDTIVDNLVDDIDALNDFNGLGEDYLKDRFGDATEAEYYEAVAESANDLIPALEKGGQISGGFQVQAPLTPLLIRSRSTKGTFSVNASVSAQFKGGFLGGPFGVKTTLGDYGALEIDLSSAANAYTAIRDFIGDSDTSNLTTQKIEDIKDILEKAGLFSAANKETVDNLFDAAANNSDTIDNVGVKSELTTNSGLDVKAAVVAHLALGYGTNLSDWFNLNTKHGTLEAGLRLNMYNVETGRNFISLQAEAKSNDDESTSDKLTEDFLDNTETSTGLGVDVGFLWHAKNYQAGITFYNLNEPSFDYPDLSQVLKDDALTALHGLQTAGKAQVQEAVTLTRHAVVEAAYFSNSRNWMLQGAYTLGTATNFVGEEFQNLHVSAGYYPKSAWIPGLRAGYSQNMKGTELSKIHAGATFFGIMHLDVSMATETSSFDDNEIPRYLAFSLGFEEKF